MNLIANIGFKKKNFVAVRLVRHALLFGLYLISPTVPP